MDCLQIMAAIFWGVNASNWLTPPPPPLVSNVSIWLPPPPSPVCSVFSTILICLTKILKICMFLPNGSSLLINSSNNYWHMQIYPTLSVIVSICLNTLPPLCQLLSAFVWPPSPLFQWLSAFSNPPPLWLRTLFFNCPLNRGGGTILTFLGKSLLFISDQIVLNVVWYFQP